MRWGRGGLQARGSCLQALGSGPSVLPHAGLGAGRAAGGTRGQQARAAGEDVHQDAGQAPLRREGEVPTGQGLLRDGAHPRDPLFRALPSFPALHGDPGATQTSCPRSAPALALRASPGASGADWAFLRSTAVGRAGSPSLELCPGPHFSPARAGLTHLRPFLPEFLLHVLKICSAQMTKVESADSRVQKGKAWTVHGSASRRTQK